MKTAPTRFGVGFLSLLCQTGVRSPTVYNCVEEIFGGGLAMKINWGKRGEEKALNPEHEIHTQTDDIGTPRDSITGSRRLSPTWLDEVITDHAREGGFNNLPGKGKPMWLEDSQSEDATLNRILAHNHILPPWLVLQREIRDDIASLLMDNDDSEQTGLQDAVRRLNTKIKKYNSMCPNPILQKPFLTTENLQVQHQKWM